MEVWRSSQYVGFSHVFTGLTDGISFVIYGGYSLDRVPDFVCCTHRFPVSGDDEIIRCDVGLINDSM